MDCCENCRNNSNDIKSKYAYCDIYDKEKDKEFKCGLWCLKDGK